LSHEPNGTARLEAAPFQNCATANQRSQLADFLRSAGHGHGGGSLRAEILGASQEQLFDFHVLQRLLAAEQVRDQGDLGEVLDGFHLHVGVLERVAVGDDAVVRHEDGVVVRNVGFETLRQF